MKTPFFGSHSVSRSSNYSDCKLINLYPEVNDSKQGKEVGALFAMPGLTSLCTAGSGPIRCMIQLGGGGLLYVVSGSTLYSVSQDFLTVTSIGSVFGSPPYTMIQNGTQLAVIGSGGGTVYSIAGGLAQITLPFSNAGTVIPTQEDGFGLIHKPFTNIMFQSALLDLSSWPAGNFASASADPDNIIALAQTHREIYVVKQFNTEVWVNAGASPFTFQRLDGPYMEVGTVAPQSVTKVGENLMWLSQNTEGQGIVVEIQSFRPTRISTHALETELATYSNITDAIGFAYQYGGHEFYVLTFPTPNITWVYDKTTSEMLKTPFWFQWLALQSGNFTRHLANCFGLFNVSRLVGSYLDGQIYLLDPAALADGTFTRQWLRTWRALPQATQQPTRFSSLTIDMETGGTGTTGSPTCSLRWSDDGGHTYSSPVTASVGTLGQTALRVKFNRLGSTRRNNGLDRIFELSSSSVFPARLIAADLE